MYGKIYEQTFTGSMFGKGVQVFAVWSYVIANTKPDSLVELNPDMLAAMLGSTSDEIQKAIDFLCAPDPKSRSHKFEGRRLVEQGPFIYFVPNATKYRGLANDATRRQYFAEKQREHRQRLKDCQTGKSKMSSSVKQAEAVLSTHKAEAEQIYCAYPKKVGKPEAIKAILRALSKTQFGTLLQRTLAFAAARNGDISFCPNPSTWFNQERFNDDPKTWQQSVSNDRSNRMTKYGYPLPYGCTIARNGDVLDSSGRVMDVNQVRRASEFLHTTRHRTPTRTH